MHQLIPDQDLLEDILLGGNKRRKALEFIYLKSGQRQKVINYLRSKGCRLEDAEDLYQDAIIIFERKVISGAFQRKSSISNFIFGIAKMNWLNKARKNSKTTYLDEKIGEEVYVPEDELVLEERRKYLDILLDMTGEKCKQILLLFRYDFSMEEIAQIMGFKDKAQSRKEKYRCIKRIRDMLESNSEIMNFIQNEL
jgi:RNA polymerase sigma factor (sigma-70 family)